MSKLAAFQSRLSAKIAAITYKDVTPPKSSANVLASFLSASNAKSSTSNMYRVNVCPDLIPSLLFLLNTTSQERSILEKMSNPKATQYTLMAYKLHLIYSWFLLHDLYVTPGSCQFAEDLIEDTYFANFIEETLDYPVPEDVITVITFWTTTCLESAKNIFFAPSLAHYLHYTHFGRLVPVNFFFNAHDIIASFSANTKAPELHASFCELPLYTIAEFVADPITAPNTTANRSYSPREYFSFLYENATTATTIERLANKQNQIISSFLKFDSIKGLKAKGDYAPINIQAPVLNGHHGVFNPYVMLMCATRHNVTELRTVYTSVHSVINECKLSNTNLAKCFDTIPSSGILNHGYSDFPLPHWDAECPALTTDSDAFKKMSLTNVSTTTFASLIRFKADLSPADPATPNTPVADPRATTRDLTFGDIDVTATPLPATPALTSLNVQVSFSVRNGAPIFGPRIALQRQTIDLNPPANRDINFPEPAAYPAQTITFDQVTQASLATGPLRSFDPILDVVPRVKVLGPQGLLPESVPLVCLRGLIIYSEDVTNSSVPQLHSQDEIYDDNAQFLQSAIPMSLTHLATHFKSESPIISRSTALPRTSASTQASTSMIRSPFRVYMPRLAHRIFHFGHDRLFYGLTEPTADQHIPTLDQTFIGHTVATRNPIRRALAAQEPPNTSTGQLLIWSPFTFRSEDFVLQDDTSILDILRNTQYLVNLRTLFGTAQSATVCESPIHAMPSIA